MSGQKQQQKIRQSWNIFRIIRMVFFGYFVSHLTVKTVISFDIHNFIVISRVFIGFSVEFDCRLQGFA